MYFLHCLVSNKGVSFSLRMKCLDFQDNPLSMLIKSIIHFTIIHHLSYNIANYKQKVKDKHWCLCLYKSQFSVIQNCQFYKDKSKKILSKSSSLVQTCIQCAPSFWVRKPERFIPSSGFKHCAAHT